MVIDASFRCNFCNDAIEKINADEYKGLTIYHVLGCGYIATDQLCKEVNGPHICKKCIDLITKYFKGE